MVLRFTIFAEKAKQTAMVGQTLGKLDKAIETITSKLAAQAGAAAGGGAGGGGAGGGGADGGGGGGGGDAGGKNSKISE